MRGYEGLAVAYFAALAVAALAAAEERRTGVPVDAARRRFAVVLLSLVTAGAVAAAAFYGTERLRAWLPHAYLVAGYWLPALIAGRAPHPTRFERWLQRADDVLRPAGVALPAFLKHLTELAYLLCYPLVPAAFAVVWFEGSSADVHRFWTAVLSAGYACYGSLPWLVSRPPRLAARPAAVGALPQMSARHRIADANVFVLGRVSHELNTFPSGHVAVSLASAACVASVSTTAGAVVGLASLAIAVGAAAGRYHYVLDVILGLIVGAAAAAFALLT
jgi:membrane-associated phospholipid phosphatase